MRLFLVLLTIFGGTALLGTCVPEAEGSGCGTVSYAVQQSYATYAAPVQAVQSYATYYQAVPVLQYSIGYDSGSQGLKEELLKLQLEFRTLQLEQLKQQQIQFQAQPPAQQYQQPPAYAPPAYQQPLPPQQSYGPPPAQQEYQQPSYHPQPQQQYTPQPFQQTPQPSYHPQQPLQQMPQQQPYMEKTSALNLLQNKCSRCHEANRAKVSGGDFVLFHGNRLAQLTRQQVDLLKETVVRGTMPKGGRLSGSEVWQIIQGL